MQTERSLTKSGPFFQEPDLRYLVENIWNSQSVLSAREDLFDLILVRSNKYEEWSPWNCILLTKEEASAHAKLENVAVVRLLSFVCLCCFKPLANRWVWGRCLSKLMEPQASVKVTKTTLWAAPIRHRNTENFSGNFLDTYQHPSRGREGLGAKRLWHKHKQRQRMQNDLTTKGAL